MADDIKVPGDGVILEPIKRKNVGFTVRNITPAVYLTGQYNARPEEKAVELSRLVDGLLDLGIWPSAAEAFRAGIPVGTFVLVDDRSLSQPKEAAAADERNVRVVVVKRVKIKAEPA
jgi:hypothetical protein